MSKDLYYHQDKREIRRKRIRGKIFGTKQRPRLSVFRSNKHIFAQIIDDTKGYTLVAYSDLGQKRKGSNQLAKTQIAGGVGQELAHKAIEKGIKKVVFDRGGYKYHGRVKALAEGARKGGLEF